MHTSAIWKMLEFSKEGACISIGLLVGVQMFDIFRLADEARVFLTSFTLENIFSVSENSHKLGKV